MANRQQEYCWKCEIGKKKIVEIPNILHLYFQKRCSLRQKYAIFQRFKSSTILSKFFAKSFFVDETFKRWAKAGELLFYAYVNSVVAGVVVLINAMFSCCVLIFLVKESFLHSFGSKSDRLFYFVVEAGSFCWTLLLRTCDSSLVPESHYIQAWVELMKNDVVQDPEEKAVLEAELACDRGQCASYSEFDACWELFLLPEDHWSKSVCCPRSEWLHLLLPCIAGASNVCAWLFAGVGCSIRALLFPSVIYWMDQCRRISWRSECRSNFWHWSLHGEQLMWTLTCWKWRLRYGSDLSRRGLPLTSEFSWVSYSPWATDSHNSKTPVSCQYSLC